MNRVLFYALSCPTGTTTTAQTYLDKYDHLSIYIPKVVGFCGSSTMNITLKGAPSEALSALTVSYYDYVNKTPNNVIITITTGGIYELPAVGIALNYLQVTFDVACTNTTNCYLIAPKTTY